MASTINGTSTGNGGLISTGDDSGILNIQTNETTAITVDASQNVGIGNTTPSSYNNNAYKLVIGSNSAVTGMTLASGTSAAGNIFFARGTSGTDAYDGYVQYVQGSQYMAFGTNGGSERMRITSAGNLLLGTTTNSSNSKLKIYASGQNGIDSERETTGGAGHVSFVNPNGSVGSIQTSGSSTLYNTSSDYRLKETIAPMTGALAKVAQLKPVTYKWKVDGSDGEGFIAHELAEIKPDCVSGEKDAVETYTDEDGNEATRPVYQGIDVSFLVATLTAAIQELSAKNDALTARLVALETA